MSLSARSCLLLLATSSLVTGCDADVHAPGGDPDANGTCVFGGDDAPVVPVVEGATSATFVGDYVYLPGLVDDRNAVAILKLEPKGRARFVRWSDELAPFPHVQAWQPVTGSTFVRLHDNQLDVLDAAQPEAPHVEHVYLDRFSAAGATRVVAHNGSRVYVCVGEGEYGNNQMLAVDVSDPAAPGAPEALATSACDPNDWGYSGARGALWADWHELPPGESFNAMAIYTLGAEGPALALSVVLGKDVADLVGIWNVHLSDELAVAETYDDARMLVFYPGPQPRVVVADDPGSIAFVEGRTAFSFDGSRLSSVDLDDPDDIHSTGRVATLSLDAELPSVGLLLGHDRTRGLFTDFDGRLYVVPLDADGEIAPLVIDGIPGAPPTQGCLYP